MNMTFANPENFGRRSRGNDAPLCPEFSENGAREFCTWMPPALANHKPSHCYRVLDIFRLGHVLKILYSVIEFIEVFVIYNHSFRFNPKERHTNKMVNKKVFGVLGIPCNGASKTYPWIPRSVEVWFYYFSEMAGNFAVARYVKCSSEGGYFHCHIMRGKRQFVH